MLASRDSNCGSDSLVSVDIRSRILYGSKYSSPAVGSGSIGADRMGAPCRCGGAGIRVLIVLLVPVSAGYRRVDDGLADAGGDDRGSGLWPVHHLVHARHILLARCRINLFSCCKGHSAAEPIPKAVSWSF